MILQNTKDVIEIELPKVPDYRGNLSFLYSEDHVPFKIQQVYWLYDIPLGAKRKGYASTNHKEFIIALSGSFTISISDGSVKKELLLNNPQKGVFINSGIWREIRVLSNDSVALILSDGV